MIPSNVTVNVTEGKMVQGKRCYSKILYCYSLMLQGVKSYKEKDVTVLQYNILKVLYCYRPMLQRVKCYSKMLYCYRLILQRIKCHKEKNVILLQSNVTGGKKERGGSHPPVREYSSPPSR